MQYLSPFSAAYWRESAAQFKKVRVLCIAALMVALYAVLSLFSIPVAVNLNIRFTFVASLICSLICGPLVGLVCGVASDVLSYFLHPVYGFFPGYTLSCVLTYLVFSLFFFRRRVTALNLLLSRLLVNLFINVGLGSLWSAMLMGKGYYYYFATSVIKNAVMLPVEVILIYLLLRLLLPVMSRMSLIPAQNKPDWV